MQLSCDVLKRGALQVHINGRNEMEVLVNGDQMEFNEELMMDFEGVIIIKYNNTSKYSAVFSSGISVTVEKAEDILQMMLLVPPMFKGEKMFFLFTSILSCSFLFSDISKFGIRFRKFNQRGSM